MALSGKEILLKRPKYPGAGARTITLCMIPTWREDNLNEDSRRFFKEVKYEMNDDINNKVSIYVGDITELGIDALVTPGNNALTGCGGVDGAIHRTASRELLMECSRLGGCETGCAKITKGYRMPAYHVIHTVGPIGEKPRVLRQCYECCLYSAKDNNFRTIAFPPISTGVYRYPNENAAHVALKTTREWLDEYSSHITRIIFCLVDETDIEIYKRLMHLYFPLKPYVKKKITIVKERMTIVTNAFRK